MASALLRMGRIKGVARPAIATLLPTPGSTSTVFLDAGANAECRPEWLVQFGKMGSVFAQHRLGISEPRIGLLSIGEEPGKGSPFVKEAYEEMSKASWSSEVFLGNVEGRDLMSDEVDVVVTDGFTGNVALKTLEGSLKTLMMALFTALGERPEAAKAAEVLSPELGDLYNVFHPDSYGGAMLLGVKGVCIISHGSSTALAIENAIKVASEMVESDVVGSITSAVSEEA